MYYAIVNNVFRHDLKQHNKKFNDSHLLILVYMQKFKGYNGIINFSMGWLIDDLKINYNQQQTLINCFIDLVDWNLIELLDSVDKITKNTRLQVRLCEYEDRFTQVLLSEFDKIFSIEKVDIRVKKTMLFLYTDIASWIDTKGYCYTSYYFFKKDLNTSSDNRINDALVLLKEHNLIDYDNVGQILVDGRIEQGNNVYVLCSDEKYKSNLLRGLSNRKKDYEDKKQKVSKGITSNKKRGLKQRKNTLDKKYNDKTITDGELKELRKVEKEYFELNKLDKDKLLETNFITIDIDSILNNKVEDKVDLETGEVLDNDNADSWGESNPMENSKVSDAIDKMKSDISNLEVQLQLIEKTLRFYKSKDKLTKQEQEKCKTLIDEYKNGKEELEGLQEEYNDLYEISKMI